MSTFTFSAIYFISLVFAIEANKYLKDKQKINVDANNLMYNAAIGRHFRMIKVQEIWNKAEKFKAPSRLAIQKIPWAEICQVIGNGHCLVLSKTPIARKYDLGEFSEMNKLHIPDPHMNREATKLKSKHLKKLWKQAHYSGFTDEELSKLQDEFLKHQQKLDEYEQMKEKLAELESSEQH
ncbi:alpha-2-macroglobulin receptor-associated protein [Octopus bimaculoides]|uniref:alpha-2-macroglobulin receptor-associated protein n=1 Tax=Octopus bimaculoides TaxID=37653 RepID=UPI00071C71A0|nr:alpha-2-macroglobulin receptor-associated protein [Octopus bimaculoides]|eukprot:XP_014784239.1 PREDICTED: alpha-2-macroglobulin receptor-associated protein-like [Octopus bimaculoides]